MIQNCLLSYLRIAGLKKQRTIALLWLYCRIYTCKYSCLFPLLTMVVAVDPPNKTMAFIIFPHSHRIWAKSEHWDLRNPIQLQSYVTFKLQKT